MFMKRAPGPFLFTLDHLNGLWYALASLNINVLDFFFIFLFGLLLIFHFTLVLVVYL